MFFLLAIGSALFFALQGTLMARVYRELDQLSAVSYRGLSLGITMLPLLLFVPLEQFQETFDLLPALLVASLIGGLSSLFFALTVKKLIVGMANSVCFCVSTLSTVLIDRNYFKRALSWEQLVLIGLLLLVLSSLSLGRESKRLTRGDGVLYGILYGIISGSLVAIAFTIVGELSKDSHPLLVGYVWEFTIGIVTAALAVSRGCLLPGKGLAPISRALFTKILIYSSPTILGTGFYLTALTLGPLPVAMALLSTTIIFSIIFGSLMYQEHITIKQGVLLLVITGLVAALKFVG